MNSLKIKKILVPVDFSTTGEKVLDQAVLMAKKANAEITLYTVIEGPMSNNGNDYSKPSAYYKPVLNKMVMEWTKKQIKELKNTLAKNGALNVETKIEYGIPYKKTLEFSKRNKFDIILMGTHGISGFREYSIGSNTFKIVSETECPVLSVQKHTATPDFKQILLPFRDRPHSREGVDSAIAMAKLYGATVNILGIYIDSSALKKLKLEAEQIKGICRKQGVQCTVEVIKGKYVSKLILDYAKKKKADLIVLMADLDKFTISEFIVGPVIQQIVNHSSIPILSIPPLINPKNIEYDNMF